MKKRQNGIGNRQRRDSPMANLLSVICTNKVKVLRATIDKQLSITRSLPSRGTPRRKTISDRYTSMGRACEKIFTKPPIGTGRLQTKETLLRNAIWLRCTFAEEAWHETIHKRRCGFGPLPSVVTRRLARTSLGCTTPARVYRLTIPKRQNGCGTPQKKGTHVRRWTSGTFTNKERVYHLITLRHICGTRPPWIEENSGLARDLVAFPYS